MDWVYNISGSVLSIIPSGRLPTNRMYTVTIPAGISGVYEGSGVLLDSAYTFWFTSAYCPLFTTINRIRLQIGPIGDNIIDDTIYRMISKNSIDAIDLLRTVSSNDNIAYDYYGCSWHNVPPIVKMYVECKTAYDILALIELLNNSGGGAASQLKTLGDMTIQYGGPNASASKVDPGKKKQLYDCWMEMLNGIKALSINSAVRGWYDTSKGFPHPTYNPDHNRVIRTVDFRNSHPSGPWEKSYYWRSNI
jgi:hypothetical protein